MKLLVDECVDERARFLFPEQGKRPAPSALAGGHKDKPPHNKTMRRQVLRQVLHGAADANIRFDNLRSLLTTLGFDERIKGSHHIFTKVGGAEILNLQPRGWRSRIKSNRSVL